MSLVSAMSGALDWIVAAAKTAATVARKAGVTSVPVAGTQVSISALLAQLDMLAKADPGNAILSSLHFTSLKDFLLSQQFDTDLVDIADLLGVIGLAFPLAAVAASDLRTVATVLTVAHAIANGLLSLDLFTGLVPANDGAGTLVSQSWAADPRHQLNPDGSFKN